MTRAPKLPQIDAEERFLTRVAWACHVKGLTQEKVAVKLGATRLRVNKSRSGARRRRLVRITFNTAYAPCAVLESALTDRYNLTQACVAPALGNLLSETLADPTVKLFGMSCGNTRNLATRFVAALERHDPEIISVMGGHSRGSDLMGAQHSYFMAPLYAGSAESHDTDVQLDVFRKVLKKLQAVDALVMAAGDLSKQSLQMRDALPALSSIEELTVAGGIGDVLGTANDAQGRALDHPISERVIGIGWADPARIPNVILAAVGPHKVAVNRALLGLGVGNTLVTDVATAQALIS